VGSVIIAHVNMSLFTTDIFTGAPFADTIISLTICRNVYILPSTGQRQCR